MKTKTKISLLALTVVICAGCSDRYDEGYVAGYAAAQTDAKPALVSY